MKGLIPLKLQTSTSFGSDTKQCSPESLPSQSDRRRQSGERIIPLPVVYQPEQTYTRRSWRQELDEIKSSYMNKQYKRCSTHCVRVLECARGLIHPLYTVYVSFYGGLSFELMARSLQVDSVQHEALLQESWLYYRKAQFYLPQASFNKSPSSSHGKLDVHRSISSASSASSRSSGKSTFSMTSSRRSSLESLITSFTPSPSPTSSPTFSVSSIYTPIGSPAELSDSSPGLHIRPVRSRKKVSFSPTLPTVVSVSNLTFDDASIDVLAPSSCGEGLQRSGSRARSAPVGIARLGPNLPINPIPQDSSSLITTTPAMEKDRASSSPASSSYLVSSSISRYEAHLVCLRPLLRSHIADVENMIRAFHTAPSRTMGCEGEAEQTRQIRVFSLSEAILQSRGDHCGEDSFLPENGGVVSVNNDSDGVIAGQADNSRARELKLKTDQLRKRGKKWRRFDGSKIEELCKQALMELDDAWAGEV